MNTASPTPAEIERNRAIAKAEDEARADMATSIDEKIINPFGLLAGLLATVHDEMKAPSARETRNRIGISAASSVCWCMARARNWRSKRWAAMVLTHS